MARPIATVERVMLPVVVVFDLATRWLGDLVDGGREIEEQFLPD